ncbi:MAG: tetratricopeptide repeat protein, partial [Planctomycetota bacterium]
TAAAAGRAHERNEAILLRVAQYLFHGLDRGGDAVAVLEGALERGVLGLDGRIHLLDYLQRLQRWEASLPHCDALIAARPGYLDARVRKMRAHFHLQQAEALQNTYQAAVKWCQGNKRWNEREIATIAFACVETRMHEPAITHLREAIAIHTRTAPRRGVGDGTLADYYRRLSIVLQQQERTVEAVDAAAGAIVAWGGHRNQRARALGQLEQVLRTAKDLPGYVAHLTAEEARSGLQNPILRKAVGRAFAGRREWSAAAAQFRIAIAAQPNDLETHYALIEALDAQQDAAGAAQALLDATRANPFAISLYADLAERYGKLKDDVAAERARTTMIEMQPNESESHAALAAIRLAQGRPTDAVHHWQRVVAIRSDEPAGYFGLADALAASKAVDEARTVLQGVLGRAWEERFGDVHARAREELLKLDK